MPPLAGDVRAITELLHTTWLATYPNRNADITVGDINDIFKTRYSQKRLAWEMLRVLRPPINQKSLIAKEGSTIVGFCRISAFSDMNELESLYVLPEYQGHGIGQALWMSAQEYSNPLRDTSVLVVSYNERAITFYKKLGFKDEGVRSTHELRTEAGTVQFPITEMVRHRSCEL